MSKRFLIAAFALLAVSVNAASYFTAGDSVRINPNKFLGGYFTMTYTASLDGYCDAWSLNMSYPDGIMPKLVDGITPLSGMTVSYLNRTGAYLEQECPLQVSAAYATISSRTTGDGYWLQADSEGDYYENYGSVKWSPGDYEMFSMMFYISPDFRAGDIVINGHITSGTDRRGPVLADYYFTRTSHLWVGYQRGDIDGNDKIGMGDLTELINLLLGGEPADEFQLPAADWDVNGVVDMDDMTKLINYLLNA